ncbi:hypothetical protein ACEQ8H_008497 [Pleosporales sp. CAS-2024a]
MVIGNWDICLSIVNSLVPAEFHQDNLKCQVSILTYRSQSLHLPPHVSPYAIEHRKSDFSPKSLEEAFAGQDVVISTISGGDFKLQITIIDALVAAGVKRFIPHEFGHDTLNQGIQARIPKYAGRAKVLHHLENKVAPETPGFDWIGIATGYTLDSNLINGDLGFDMEWHSATIQGTGDELFAVSSLARIGQVVTKVLQYWSEMNSKYVYAAGVITSANDILWAAEQATGQQWTVGNHDVQDSVKEGMSRIERGFPDAGLALLDRSVLYDEELSALGPFQSQSVNEVLQLHPESIDEIVQAAYHDLQKHGKPGCGCSS